jgi:flagellar biosynthesis/type III secretory pathway M-ring protein FliF/YscJ
MSNTLPPNTGYVAAAYLVFLFILLIYIVIMAIRAARVERELAELLAQSQQRAAAKTEEGSQ